MKRLTLGLPAIIAGLVMAPNLASALPAVTTGPTNLRAGPAFDFPVVDRIPSDVRVNVHGCVRAYRWCDVSWRDARGWVPGNELAYLYDGRRVTIIEYGPRIGLPVVVFSFDNYWNRYYRGRSWYGERARWRSVWREREGREKQTTDRARDREKDRIDRRTDRREVDRTDRTREGSREVDRAPSDRSERRMDRRTDRKERGEVRGYNPPQLHQEMDGGPRQGVDPGRGRAAPRDRTPRGPGGDRAGDGRGRE